MTTWPLLIHLLQSLMIPILQNCLHAASVLKVHCRSNEKWQRLKVNLRVAKASKDQLKTKEIFPPNPRRAVCFTRQQTNQVWVLECTLERQLEGGVHWKHQTDWNLMQKWPCVFWMCKLTSNSVTFAEKSQKCFYLYIYSRFCLSSFIMTCC